MLSVKGWNLKKKGNERIYNGSNGPFVKMWYFKKNCDKIKDEIKYCVKIEEITLISVSMRKEKVAQIGYLKRERERDNTGRS